MTILANGRVGINTTSPSTTLDVSGGINTNSVLTLMNPTANKGHLRIATDAQNSACFIQSGLTNSSGSAAPLYFTDIFAANTWMTILANGRVGIGTTTPSNILDIGGAITFNVAGVSYGVINHASGVVGGNWYMAFNLAGTTIGTITQVSTNGVAYNVNSDKRLKEDLGILTETNVIDNIKIHNFKWKNDNSIDIGVFAQEAYEIKPSAVTIGTDELNEDGNLKKPWSVDYSKFVPDLIVYCQTLKRNQINQQSTIESQQSTIQSLEQRLALLEQRFA
jgi:hypothetical protein